jgi:hypothetical protein
MKYTLREGCQPQRGRRERNLGGGRSGPCAPLIRAHRGAFFQRGEPKASMYLWVGSATNSSVVSTTLAVKSRRPNSKTEGSIDTEGSNLSRSANESPRTWWTADPGDEVGP